MAGRDQLLGLAGRVVAVLLVLTACAGAENAAPDGSAPGGQGSTALPLAGRTAPVPGPVVVDTVGAPLTPEHAEVVHSVHRALRAGDLAALGALYAGDDWAGQAQLLAQEPVRRSVLAGLATHPANLGEGYVYPGLSVNGWAGPVERADGAVLGLDPATLPDPTTSYPGYQTAFFLDYDPPHSSGGPLRWRGIAQLTPALVG